MMYGTGGHTDICKVRELMAILKALLHMRLAVVARPRLCMRLLDQVVALLAAVQAPLGVLPRFEFDKSFTLHLELDNVYQYRNAAPTRIKRAGSRLQLIRGYYPGYPIRSARNLSVGSSRHNLWGKDRHSRCNAVRSSAFVDKTSCSANETLTKWYTTLHYGNFLIL